MSTQQLSLGFTLTALFNSIAEHYSNEIVRSKPFHLTDAARETLEVVSLLIGDDLVADSLKMIEEGRIVEYMLPGASQKEDTMPRRGLFSISPSTKSPQSHIVRLHAWHCDCFEFIMSEATEKQRVVQPSYQHISMESSENKWCWGGFCSGATDQSPPVCAHLVACALVMAVPGMARDRIKSEELDRLTAGMLGIGQL